MSWHPLSCQRWILLSCCLLVTGCISLAPDYARPEAPIPAAIGTIVGRNQVAGEFHATTINWRQVFDDPRLQQVIDSALEHNRNLRIALLNIDKARAQYSIQRAGSLPAINAKGSHSTSRSSAAASLSGQPGIARTYSADIGISSWELDLFGRIHSLNAEALEIYLATEQSQHATRLSLMAEVADAWLMIGAYRARLDLAEQTLKNQQQSFKLTEYQHQRGLASGLDLAQAQTSIQSARVDVASFSTALNRARNALDLVVGAPVPEILLPASLGNAYSKGAITLLNLPEVIDSTALLQRPDVLAAEYQLRAATADIGAARAAFFPSISLTASAGQSSTQLSALFNGANRTWSFIPSINLPIFRGGALKAQLDVAKITQHIQIAQYEKTIQTAFREVADALAERQNLQEQLDAQDALVATTQHSYRLAEARYRNGVTSFLEVLDSQRSMYTAQQNLISLRMTEASNRILLFKTLGGATQADVMPNAPLEHAEQ